MTWDFVSPDSRARHEVGRADKDAVTPSTGRFSRGCQKPAGSPPGPSTQSSSWGASGSPSRARSASLACPPLRRAHPRRVARVGDGVLALPHSALGIRIDCAPMSRNVDRHMSFHGTRTTSGSDKGAAGPAIACSTDSSLGRVLGVQQYQSNPEPATSSVAYDGQLPPRADLDLARFERALESVHREFHQLDLVAFLLSALSNPRTVDGAGADLPSSSFFLRGSLGRSEDCFRVFLGNATRPSASRDDVAGSTVMRRW